MPHPPTPPSAEFEREIRELYHERNSRGFSAPVPKQRFRWDMVALLVFSIISSGAMSVITVSLLQPSLNSLPPVERSVRRAAEPATQVLDEEVINRLSGSVVSVFLRRAAAEGMLESAYLAQDSLGQGLVLSSDGWLVTTQAVVPDARRNYAVATADGVVHEVSEVVIDPVIPLTYLKVSARNLSATAFVPTENLTPGQRLIVPAIDTQSASRSLYQVNLVNSAARTPAATRADLAASSESLPDRYLIDRSLSDALLGAPVATPQGEVIGLLATYGDETRAVVPLDTLANIIDSLFTSQEVQRPVLGVTYVQHSWLTPFSADEHGSDGVALIGSSRRPAVIPKGPAEAAGLKDGDEVVAVAGERLASRSLSSVIQQYRPGASLELDIVRNGKPMTVSVTLGAVSAKP